MREAALHRRFPTARVSTALTYLFSKVTRLNIVREAGDGGKRRRNHQRGFSARPPSELDPLSPGKKGCSSEGVKEGD